MWNCNTSTFNSTQHHKPITLTSYAQHKVSIPYFELILALAHVYSESNDGWRHWYYILSHNSTSKMEKPCNSIPLVNVNYFLDICYLLDWHTHSFWGQAWNFAARQPLSYSIFFLLLASTMCIVAQAMPSTTIVEISRIVVLVGKLPSHFSYFGVPNT